MANIIGIDDLKKHLNTFKSISKIEVCEREASKRAIVIFIDNQVTQLLTFLDTQKEYEAARFAPFYVKVFLKGPNTKNENGNDLIGFTFAFEERNKPLQVVNGPGTGAGVSQSDLLTVYSENGFYRAENRRLVEQVEDLESEIEELIGKLESPEASINGTGDVEKWMSILTQVKQVFPGIGGLLGGGTPALSQDPELNNIIAECILMDPGFKPRMQAFLNSIKNPVKNNANTTN